MGFESGNMESRGWVKITSLLPTHNAIVTCYRLLLSTIIVCYCHSSTFVFVTRHRLTDARVTWQVDKENGVKLRRAKKKSFRRGRKAFEGGICQ